MEQSKMVNAWNGSDFVWRTYVIWTLTERKKMYEKCQFRNVFLIPKIDYHCHLCLVFFFFLSFNFSKISFLEGERKWFYWFQNEWIFLWMVTCILTIWCFYFLHFHGINSWGQSFSWCCRCNGHNDGTIWSTNAKVTVASICICANLNSIWNWLYLWFDWKYCVIDLLLVQSTQDRLSSGISFDRCMEKG